MRIRFRALTRKGTTAAQYDKLIRNLVAEAQKFGDETIADFKEYPPVPAGSRYERTFSLQKSLYSKAVFSPSTGLTLNIGSYKDVAVDKYGRSYAGFVIGDEQTDFHIAHGWKSITKLANSVYFRRFFQEAMQEQWNEFAMAYNGS